MRKVKNGERDEGEAKRKRGKKRKEGGCKCVCARACACVFGVTDQLTNIQAGRHAYRQTDRQTNS